MLFRNLTAFRVSPKVASEVLTVEERLGEHRLRPVGSMEIESRGFVSPYGKGEEKSLVQVSAPYVLMCVGHESKLLPAAVINEKLADKVAKIAEEEGRKVGGRERKSLKDDIINECLPQAFVRSGRQSFYVDTRNGWVVVDASSAKSAEGAISQLREAMGSFPAVPLAPEESVRVLMTDWLANGNLPEDLLIGEACELKDAADSKGATIKAKNQDLSVDEIKDHLRAGKQVTQLGLTYKERLSFMLDENLVVRSLKFLDVAMESIDQAETSDAASELDTTFALMTLEVNALLDRLAEIFKVPAPEDSEA